MADEEKNITSPFDEFRKSGKLITFVVALAMMVDTMLMTIIVPIMPDILYDLSYRNFSTSESNHSALNENITYIHGKEEKEYKDKILLGEASEVSYMFASKTVVQLLANAVVGSLIERTGYRIPMFTGFLVIFSSCILFAFAQSYSLLFVARALQGVGSSCACVAGLGILAKRYPNDEERGSVMGFAMGLGGLGCAIGPVLGGFLYQFIGKTSPFLVMAGLAFIDGFLQLIVILPKDRNRKPKHPSLISLLSDPYIAIAAGVIVIGNSSISVIEASLPIRLSTTLGSSNVAQGLIFLPIAVAFVISSNIFGSVSYQIGRWLVAILGLLLAGFSTAMIPMIKNYFLLMAPNFILGVSMAMIMSSMMPQLGLLVDTRHESVYGSIYAIADTASCVASSVGLIFGGILIEAVGFDWMQYGIAILCFSYAPFAYFLRNPPHKKIPDTMSNGVEVTKLDAS